jgi:hypothetical protein
VASRQGFGASNINRMSGINESLKEEVIFLEDIHGPVAENKVLKTKYKASDLISNNEDVDVVKVKYKPREITAYFIESNLIPDEKHLGKKRTSGWLIPDLISEEALFFIPEDRFDELFDIVEGE